MFSEDSERWNRFQACVCYDTTTQTFCSANPNRTVIANILSQCWPYMKYELQYTVYWGLACIFCFLLFIFFLSGRYCCNTFGGWAPSKGIVVISKRSPFRGYSAARVRGDRWMLVIGCGAAFLLGGSLLVHNSDMADHLDRTMQVLRNLVTTMQQALDLLNPIFDSMAYFIQNEVLAEVSSYADEIGSYLGQVNGAADLVKDISRIRSLVTQLFLYFALGTILLGVIMALKRWMLRGLVHIVLGFSLALIAIGIGCVSMLHLILDDTLHDMCRYVRAVDQQVANFSSEGCGKYNINLGELANQAETEYVAYTCDNDLKTLCSTDFDCSTYNVCDYVNNTNATYNITNVSTTITAAVLKIGGVPSGLTLPLCLLEPTCFGNLHAQHLANQTVIKFIVVSTAFEEIETKLVPVLRCTVGASYLNDLISNLCTVGPDAENISYGGTAFFVGLYLIAAGFVIGSKRFAIRNSVEEVQYRRAKMLLRRGGLSKPEALEVIRKHNLRNRWLTLEEAVDILTELRFPTINENVDETFDVIDDKELSEIRQNRKELFEAIGNDSTLAAAFNAEGGDDSDDDKPPEESDPFGADAAPRPPQPKNKKVEKEEDKTLLDPFRESAN